MILWEIAHVANPLVNGTYALVTRSALGTFVHAGAPGGDVS